MQPKIMYTYDVVVISNKAEQIRQRIALTILYKSELAKVIFVLIDDVFNFKDVDNTQEDEPAPSVKGILSDLKQATKFIVKSNRLRSLIFQTLEQNRKANLTQLILLEHIQKQIETMQILILSDLKQATKFIVKSNRLRSLIIFDGVFS